MMGAGVGGEIAKASGAFFFVWTLLALGVTAIFSLILSVRGLWSLPGATLTGTCRGVVSMCAFAGLLRYNRRPEIWVQEPKHAADPFAGRSSERLTAALGACGVAARTFA